MKFSFFALFALVMFSFNSCDKDEAEVKLNSENIQGTWNLTTYDSDADVSIGIGPLAETTNSVSSMTNSTVTVTFAADGTWTSTGDYTISITSNGETETEDITDGIGNGTYTVANGQLTMNNIDAGDESDVEEVVFMTTLTSDTKIDLVGSSMEMETDPFFGLDITVDLDLNMTLEK